MEKLTGKMEKLQSVQTEQGHEITLYGKKQQRDNILIIGVFHGDEPQGNYLINKYISSGQLTLENARNNLLFIPCLNPDGMLARKRTNFNSVDLNRNFPTKNWGQDTSAAGSNPEDYFAGNSPASEIETRFVLEVLDNYKPKIILTLHAPYKVVNYDGPAKKIAETISGIIHYPVEKSIGYPTPGSFGTYCGIERDIPTITLELENKVPATQLEQPVFEIFDFLKFMV